MDEQKNTNNDKHQDSESHANVRVERFVMLHIDWNQMSELGLIERINREILHPLGLAVSRDVETGHSTKILIADDGCWEYDPHMETTIISDNEVRLKLTAMAERA